MKKIIFICIGIIMIIIALFYPMTTAIVFYDKQADEIIAYRPVNKEDTFQIIFVHSIHLTDVTEKYLVMNDLSIKQYEMSFSQFGIGMPSEVKEQEEIYYKDGFYHIVNINNRFESLHIRNGKTVSKHRFIWQNDQKEEVQVYLNEYMDPGTSFVLDVKKLSFVNRWKEVKIDE